MTIPIEEKNALNFAGRFLCELIDPSRSPRIPRAVRNRASSILRHYPAPYKVEHIYRAEIAKWEKQMISPADLEAARKRWAKL